eukprot:GHVT01060207.1.p1 GENE.GHVT01060207.1~~GHVT01060207.1.p1  ORF type:complete len:232 (-),score=14.78 GHVT01060207.1:176-871(-)
MLWLGDTCWFCCLDFSAYLVDDKDDSALEITNCSYRRTTKAQLDARGDLKITYTRGMWRTSTEKIAVFAFWGSYNIYMLGPNNCEFTRKFSIDRPVEEKVEPKDLMAEKERFDQAQSASMTATSFIQTQAEADIAEVFENQRIIGNDIFHINQEGRMLELFGDGQYLPQALDKEIIKLSGKAIKQTNAIENAIPGATPQDLLKIISLLDAQTQIDDQSRIMNRLYQRALDI